MMNKILSNEPSNLGRPNDTSITGVTFLLVRRSEEILLQLRDSGRGNERIEYPNTWCFPGGHKDKEESYIDTVLREAREEFGISIEREDCELIYIYDHGNTVDNHVFLCRMREKQTPHLREGRGMCWMNLREIEDFQLGFHQEKIIPYLREYLATSIANLHGPTGGKYSGLPECPNEQS